MMATTIFNTLRMDLEQKEEKTLAAYAIKSKCTPRLYMENYISCPRRTEFERDKDRIIYSLAFKRLMEKTQVYMTNQGDHYTNRLSHTLEVTQLSRSIATSLGLNSNLAESIALGHDLGHTPFGHAVESVFNNSLEGGFEHNCQSVLVVDYLETKSNNNETPQGLNLTNYTRYGILHHTKLPKELQIYNTNNDNIAISSKYKSIESDLVCKIDTLAYLYHDLEDAINNKNILQDMKLNDPTQFRSFLDELNYFTNLACKILKIEMKPIIDLWSDYNSNTILKAMIKDLIYGTQQQISGLKINSSEDIIKYPDISIADYDLFKNDFKKYKDFMKKYIYNSPIACQMDTKATIIAKRLFESFNSNPEQLPYKTRKIYENAKAGIITYERKDAGYDITPQRVIANYIAGMTDRYALENYKRMFE